MEIFNLNELREVGDKEKHPIEVSNRFAPVEGLEAEVDIDSAWATIRKKINISAKGSLGYYEHMVRRRMIKIITSKERS
jgi:hypothetical protein